MRIILILAIVLLIFVFLGPVLLEYGMQMKSKIMKVWEDTVYKREDKDEDV